MAAFFPLQAAIQLAAEVHQLLVASCQVGDRLQVAVALVAHRAGQLVEVLRIVPPLLAKLAQQAPGFAAVHAVESLQAGFRRLRRAFDQAGVALIAFLADVHEEGVQGFLRGEPHLVQGEQVIGGPCREDGEAQQAEQGQTKSERTADHGFHLHVALEAFLLFFCNGPWPIMHGDLRRL